MSTLEHFVSHSERQEHRWYSDVVSPGWYWVFHFLLWNSFRHKTSVSPRPTAKKLEQEWDSCTPTRTAALICQLESMWAWSAFFLLISLTRKICRVPICSHSISDGAAALNLSINISTNNLEVKLGQRSSSWEAHGLPKHLWTLTLRFLEKH